MKAARSCLLCVTVVFVVIAVLCHVIALATSSWLKSSDDRVINFLEIGLWQACFDRYLHTHETPHRTYDGCHELGSNYYASIRDWLVPGWLVSCQVLAVIALLLQIVGLVFVLLLLLWVLCRWICCNGKDDPCERILLYATPIIWIVTGMFLMMTVMIFADNAFRLQCKDYWLEGGEPNANHLSYSWGFEIAACIFSFISGGLLIWVVVLKGREKF
ncbi:hypothetical protein CAPTEDRAFT_225855 [Capitella teleta]|uniref:Claudin n=1 Tax=Capitella teleta TaxID=283909 RepID=R7TLR0_CAPTE|nr:hypothetical protein CAPTEDRAFT_225855 [Capitella teleta]|eukprot:ELT94604.1 hypothetical protein CAPTEDRAFT_225855 [Capitella teleta]